jgi:hypothetical protein
LAEFKSKPVVSLRQLAVICQYIENRIPQQILDAHKQHKKSLGDMPVFEDGCYLVTPEMQERLLEKHGDPWRYMYGFTEDRDGGLWISREYCRPGQLPLTEREWRNARALKQGERRHGEEKASDGCSAPSLEAVVAKHHERHTSHAVSVDALERPSPRVTVQTVRPDKKQGRTVNIPLDDIRSETDSFQRQKEALMRYARYLKRVPTFEEAMQFLYDHRLYSRSWEDNLAKRKARVHNILSWIRETFDASKCAKGSVNIGKYDSWAAKAFPHGLSGPPRRSVNEYGEVTESTGVYVPSQFIAVFMAVCEFALLTNKNQDDSLPHSRAQELWEALFTKGLVAVPFCARKWAACRDTMEKFGIVRVTDRHYSSGKAMKWDAGQFFPFLGLWKGSKVRSVLGPGCFQERKRRRTRRHNTLLHKQLVPTVENAFRMPARPPP